jgi:hypothetical protein
MSSDHVVFSSRHFAIEPGEDEETNPGIYGKALATWVAAKLKQRGVAVERIVAEDFGRCVMVRSKPFMLWIGCASLDGDAARWQMFVTLEQGLIARLFGRSEAQTELDRLREHFRAIVQDIPEATDIEWQ